MRRCKKGQKRAIIFLAIMLLIFSAVIAIGYSKNYRMFDKINMGNMGKKGNSTTIEFDMGKKPMDRFNRNYISFPNMTNISAKDIIRKYPSISMIRYYDDKNNRYITYISAKGGLGKNFQIIPNQTYEISVKSNTTILLNFTNVKGK